MPDYGLLYGLASGLKGGVDESRDLKQRAIDNKNKQIQLQAMLGQSGQTLNPETGGVEFTPLTQQKQKLEGIENTSKLAEYDPNDPSVAASTANANRLYHTANPNATDDYVPAGKNRHDIENDPLLKQIGASGTSLTGKGMLAQAANARQDNATNRQQSRIDEKNHSQIVQYLKTDPQLNQRVTQYQNLDNAASNILNAQHVTPQQVDEFQQSVRSNLGIKGTSGVGERSHTYINDLELAAERAKQYLTSTPGNIDPNNPVLTHLRDLAANEQKNIQKNYDAEIKSATKGHESMYQRNPDLKDDLQDLIKSRSSQIGAQPAAQGLMQQPQAAAPAQGLVGKTSPEDLAAIQWAQSNPKDPRAAQILKLHGM